MCIDTEIGSHRGKRTATTAVEWRPIKCRRCVSNRDDGCAHSGARHGGDGIDVCQLKLCRSPFAVL